MAKRHRQRAYGSFTADVEDFVAVSDVRMLAVVQLSLQDVVNIAQTPTGKGGRMRVDTGFLRKTGLASLVGMPTGPGRGEKTAPGSYRSPDDYSKEVSLKNALLKMKLGNTFYFGWTAEYARYREVFDGFLEGALQHWGTIVAYNTDTVRERIKSGMTSAANFYQSGGE